MDTHRTNKERCDVNHMRPDEDKARLKTPPGTPKGAKWEPLEAAKDLARRMAVEWGGDGEKNWYEENISVWDADDVTQTGWGGPASAAVALEGGPYDWAVTVSLYNPNDYPGVFMEPWSGWLLKFYEA